MQQLTNKQIEDLRYRRDILLLLTDFVSGSEDFNQEQKLIVKNWRQELKDFELNNYIIKPLPEFLKLSTTYRLLTSLIK